MTFLVNQHLGSLGLPDADIITGLLGGTVFADGPGYDLAIESPNGSWCVLTGPYANNTGRFLTFNTVRGSYNIIEQTAPAVGISSETQFDSITPIDNSGAIYGYATSDDTTRKVTRAGVVTTLGTAGDIPMASGSPPELVKLFDVGGVQTLFYRTAGGATNPVYSRSTVTGVVTAIVPPVVSAAYLKTEQFIQGPGGAVFGVAPPVSGGTISDFYFWEIAGGTVHHVTGLPSLAAGSFNTPADYMDYHGGKFAMGWDGTHMLVIDASTFTLDAAVDVTALIGTSNWYFDRIDTAANQMVIDEYDPGTFFTTKLHRVNLATHALDSTVLISSLSAEPPSAATWGYPYFSYWVNGLGGYAAMATTDTASVTVSGHDEYAFQPDLAFLFPA